MAFGNRRKDPRARRLHANGSPEPDLSFPQNFNRHNVFDITTGTHYRALYGENRNSQSGLIANFKISGRSNQKMEFRFGFSIES